MPWTIENPPPPAKNWPYKKKEKCIKAANAVLKNGGSEKEAIYACINAAEKNKKANTFRKNVEKIKSIKEIIDY